MARAVYAEMSRKRTDRCLLNWETVHHSDFVGRSNDNWYNCTTGATVHNAYLDITHRDTEWLINRFLGVHAYLMSRSVPLDFTKDMIPAHPRHIILVGVLLLTLMDVSLLLQKIRIADVNIVIYMQPERHRGLVCMVAID